ncbi:MAG: phosphotransferase, partial [bacterium]|nr:phosphotransferase [bacterium]
MTEHMFGIYKRFPPRRGHLLIPVASRESALAGLALYAPTKRTGAWVQRGAWVVTSLFGPRALPARRVEIESPLGEPEPWQALVDEWQHRLGAFDATALYTPPDVGRSGLAVMLLDRGRPVAFVKVRRGAEATRLQNEATALDLMATAEPQTFSIAHALASGHQSGWNYLAITPLARELHRAPTRPPLGQIIDEIQLGLSGLPRPERTPAHWKPIHGDFTPWNLRKMRTDGLVLFDWEAAGWGPPGADLVMYLSSAAALGGSSEALARIAGEEHAEARAYWGEYWDERIGFLEDPQDSNALAVQVQRVLKAVDA